MWVVYQILGPSKWAELMRFEDREMARDFAASFPLLTVVIRRDK